MLSMTLQLQGAPLDRDEEPFTKAVHFLSCFSPGWINFMTASGAGVISV